VLLQSEIPIGSRDIRVRPELTDCRTRPGLAVTGAAGRPIAAMPPLAPFISWIELNINCRGLLKNYQIYD
jgi:hypothetical protein